MQKTLKLVYVIKYKMCIQQSLNIHFREQKSCKETRNPYQIKWAVVFPDI